MRLRPLLTFLACSCSGPLILAGCDETEGGIGPPEEPVLQAAVVAAPGAAVQSLGPVHRYSGRSHYATADFSVWTPEQQTWGFLQVFADAGGGRDSTALYYSVYSCGMEFCEPLQEGYGPIPKQDVTFGANSVTLRTNTSFESNPDFMRWAGEGGPIEVVWEKASFFSTHSIWNDQSTYGSIRAHSHGNSTHSSANASGNIVETQFVSGWAEMGSAHDVFLEISVAKVVASASGSGHFTMNGELRTFSFHALQTDDGRVGGEWQRHNRLSDAKAHGKVSCMGLNGGQAWLGGFTTRTNTAPGGVFWRVVDGGRGASAQDEISLQAVGQDDWAVQDYCWTMGEFPQLYPVESGQIKVQQ